MDKTNHSQPDLFSGTGNFSEAPGSQTKKSFFSHILTYEKVILFIIGFAVTAIVSFCLGVQKGKDISLAKFNSRFEVAKVTLKPKPVTPTPATQSNPAQTTIAGNYTIQIASYKSRQQAQIESSNLKKKALQPLLFSKNNYIIVCVGNFPDKEKATVLLTELRKQYKGCYLRRM